jgi:hypothetical protein
VARIRVGAEQHDLRAKSHEKDELARRIHEIEKLIAREKAQQTQIASESDATLRQLKAQTNLRKNVDHLIAQNHLVDEEDANEAAANGHALTPQQEQAVMAEAILKMKQQKKVLIKAVKSMQIEREQLAVERNEYVTKLEELKTKLNVFNL